MLEVNQTKCSFAPKAWSKNMSKHTGGCLCGKVRFELSDDPEAAYGCHCRFCQKATGTAFRSGMRYRKENVSLNHADLKPTFTPVMNTVDH